MVGVVKIKLLFSVTEWKSLGLNEKVIEDDFEPLIFIFQRYWTAMIVSSA